MWISLTYGQVPPWEFSKQKMHLTQLTCWTIIVLHLCIIVTVCLSKGLSLLALLSTRRVWYSILLAQKAEKQQMKLSYYDPEYRAMFLQLSSHCKMSLPHIFKVSAQLLSQSCVCVSMHAHQLGLHSLLDFIFCKLGYLKTYKNEEFDSSIIISYTRFFE